MRCGFAYVSHRRLSETIVICMEKHYFGLLFMVSGMILFMFRQLRLAMKTVCSCLASCFQATSRLDMGVLHRPERVRFRNGCQYLTYFLLARPRWVLEPPAGTGCLFLGSRCLSNATGLGPRANMRTCDLGRGRVYTTPARGRRHFPRLLRDVARNRFGNSRATYCSLRPLS